MTEETGPAGGLEEAYSHCASLLREHDRVHYWSVLLAPAAARASLAALYAFSTEIARVREAVSSPMPGEIRLQWWRDAIAGQARGDATAHPVALAISHTIQLGSLPRQAFVDMIDARVFDLYDDPIPSLADLDGYLGETSSALMRLASLILAGGQDPGFADAAGHAGVAYGLTGLLRAMPWHARQGRLYLPKDVLDRYGVTRDDIVGGRGGPGVAQTLVVLRHIARDQDERARQLLAPLPRHLRTAFLPLALVPGDLTRLEAAADPLAIPPDRSAWKAIWRLWRARRDGF